MSGCAEALGFQSLMQDMGWDEVSVVLKTDSSAAIGTSARRGLGKLRHVELRYLWLQEVVQEGRAKIEKIKGTINPADILTKPKAAKEMAEQLVKVGGVMIEQGGCDPSPYRDVRGGGVLGRDHNTWYEEQLSSSVSPTVT